MARTDLLTLQQAADQLGVHYMTVYRYVRTGRLPATKDGGEWRVRPNDLADLEAERDAAPPPRRARTRATASPGRLANRLLAGDEPGSWRVIEDTLASGAEPDDVAFELLTPALRIVGDRWESGEAGVADEHRATAVILGLLGRLTPRFNRRGRRRGTIVLGAAPGDRHGLPVSLVAGPLRARGFTVIDLGADVPATAFADAAAVTGVTAVGIVASTPGQADGVIAAIEAIREQGVEVPVVVGGAAVADDSPAAQRADRHVASGREALAAFEDLAG